MAKLNVKIDSGIRTITFTDLDDHIFSQFRVNPADIELARRAIQESEFFDKINVEDYKTVEEVAVLQKTIEEKINYVLGYDSTSDIFGEVPALTVLPDGSAFVEHVLDKLYEVVKPAAEQRSKAMRRHAEKYIGKYDKK